MVGYYFNANCILGMPIRNRKGVTIAERWKKLHEDFKKVRVVPFIYILDNEVSKDLMQGTKEEIITYQLVTLYKHRNNQAEHAIRISKVHLKSALAMVDPNFPLSNWIS